ncbi:hypothetical protein ACP275_05G081200 [Erythranthe tilingii]
MGKVSLVVAFIVLLALGINENRVEGGNVMGRKHSSDGPITYCQTERDCVYMCNFFDFKISCGCQPDGKCCCIYPKRPGVPTANVIT